MTLKMTSSQLDRYVSPAGIVAGTPRETVITIDGMVNANPTPTGSSNPWKQRIQEMERAVFTERGRGTYLVTPPECLGLDRVYRLNENTALRIGDAEAPRDFDLISLPNPAVMAELETTLPREEIEKIRVIYDRLNYLAAGQFKASIFKFVSANQPHDTVLRNDSFGNCRVGLYHNGARLAENRDIPLNSGDLIRIGPSTVFGYLDSSSQPTERR